MYILYIYVYIIDNGPTTLIHESAHWHISHGQGRKLDKTNCEV